jgi:hypothetical protein
VLWKLGRFATDAKGFGGGVESARNTTVAHVLSQPCGSVIPAHTNVR